MPGRRARPMPEEEGGADDIFLKPELPNLPPPLPYETSDERYAEDAKPERTAGEWAGLIGTSLVFICAGLLVLAFTWRVFWWIAP